MQKISKNLQKIDKIIFDNLKNNLSIESIIDILKKTAIRNFNESIDCSMRIFRKSKKPLPPIRDTIELPHNPRTRHVKISVFTNNPEEALKWGAHMAGIDNIIEAVKNNKIDDYYIVSPDLISKILPVSRILGPKGKMPNPKSGTVTTDIKGTIEKLKSGRSQYKEDKSHNIHVLIGNNNFSIEKIQENLIYLISTIYKKYHNNTSKELFFQSVYISTTMGRSIKINPFNLI